MVLNTMGMLSRAYRYGQMAYVGGGFGKGIHNTLEAAVYGIPLCFGPKNQKFLEAQALLREGLAIEVHQPNDLAVALQEWRQAEKQIQLKNKAARWFATQAGATVMVTREMTRLLGG
jgi:3-deoxy-D-manno-octulosonic-acid transferase